MNILEVAANDIDHLVVSDVHFFVEPAGWQFSKFGRGVVGIVQLHDLALLCWG
jgi:hypothetical protein